MVKLKEIAQKLGVSVSTVSAVLNGKEHCYISEDKKKLVKDTAEAMGYVPNRMSRAMRGLPTQTIGIIGKWFFSVPLLSKLINSINIELANKGYSVLLNDANHIKDLKGIFNELMSRGIDGIMVQGGAEVELADILKSHRVPYVTINKEFDGFAVTVDREAGVFEAVEHLILKHNRRRIGFLHQSLSGSILKFSGYEAALKKHGLSSYKIAAPRQFEDMDDAVREIASLKLDAVFATNDILAGLLIKRLQIAGRRVPEDISVIGFDGIDYLCEMINPTLTSVSQPIEEIAKMTVDVLLRQIQKQPAEEKTHYIKPRLMIGESCGCGRKDAL